MWEQLRRGAQALACNAASSILAFGSWLPAGQIAGRSLEYHIHAWQSAALPYCSRNVFPAGLSPAGNHCPGTASCVLTLPPGDVSQRFSPLCCFVSLLEPGTPVGTVLYRWDKSKWSKWVYCNANLRGLPVYKEIAVVQQNEFQGRRPRLSSK